MADPTPPSTTVVTDPAFKRLKTLTMASLCLNGLILLLIVLGAIAHHHQKERGFGGRDGSRDGGRFGGGCAMRFEHHRFFGGGPGMFRGPQGGWGGGGWNQRGGQGFGGQGGGGGQQGGPGFGGQGGNGFGPGGGGGFNRFGGGPGPGMPNMGRGGMGGLINGDPAKMTDMVLNQLSGKLNLTDDEKAKIKPILQDQITAIQKQMEAQRQAMQKQIEDTKAKIKPLLTPDQQKQLDALPIPGQKPSPPPGDGK